MLEYEITFPANLVSIKSSAFYNCDGLTSIDIPANVTEIEDFAFGISETLKTVTIRGNRNLGERFRLQKNFIELVNWPDVSFAESENSIRNFEKGNVLDLHGATVLEEREFSLGESQKYGNLEDLIPSGVLILPEGLKEIKDNAFEFCSDIDAVVFPKSLKTIGGNAFRNCFNLQVIEFQEGLETIGWGAFPAKNKITHVYLPNSLKTLYKGAFINTTRNSIAPYITVHMSLATAQRLKYADRLESDDTNSIVKEFVIDGISYSRFEDFQAKYAQEEQEKRERARLEQEEAEKKEAEAKKKEQRNRIEAEINRLTIEMNSQKGLFAGMKRKKLQAQIDELNDQLRRL